MYKKRPEEKPIEHQSDSKKRREKELLLHELLEAELNSDSEATVVHDRKSDNQPATFLRRGEDDDLPPISGPGIMRDFHV